MRKTARRTDIVIIVILALLAVYIALSVISWNGSSSQQAEPIPLESYNGKTLGVIPGGLSEAVTEERFPDSSYVYFTGLSELYTALTSRKIDGFVMSRIQLQQMVRQGLTLTWYPDVLASSNRYFGFAKTEKGEQLRAQMNELLSEFKADGTIEAMEDIWYGSDDSRKVLDEVVLTGENGTLQIGVNAMDEPFTYIQNGQLTGLIIDFVTRFASRYGYRVEYIDTEAQGLLIGLTTGKFDMLASAIAYSEERAQSVLFSDPALRFDNVLAVRPDAIPEQEPTLLESIADGFEKTFVRENRWRLILSGIGTTCLVTFAAALAGTILAFGICLLRRTESRLANIICDIYVRVLQGTPMVVILLILYYVVFAKSNLGAVWVAVIGFALHFGANNSETLRSGISSVPPGQREAALALGHSENEAFVRFILPQAVQRIMPVYRSEVIALLKGTAVAGYISVQDLTKISDIIRSRTYEAFFPLITTALIYFLMAWIIGLVLRAFMNRIDFQPKGRKES